MSYTRKTKDAWQVQQYTGKQYGWEEVYTGEPTEPPAGTRSIDSHSYLSGKRDALDRLKEYRANQPEYPACIRKVRVSIERITL